MAYEWTGRIKKFLNRLKGYYRRPKGIWDREYKHNRWEYLRDEGVRYEKIAGLYGRHAKPHCRILDAGGGEGILLDYIDRDSYDRYVCLDIAQSALQKGARSGKNIFVKGDMERYETDERFDIIIFNESLYYCDYRKVMKRFERFLKADGYFIVSMFNTDITENIWSWIRARYTTLERSEVLNPVSKFTSSIEALRK